MHKVSFDIHALLSLLSSVFLPFYPAHSPFLSFLSISPPSHLSHTYLSLIASYLFNSHHFPSHSPCSTFCLFLLFVISLIFASSLRRNPQRSLSASLGWSAQRGEASIPGMPATYGPHSSQSAERPTAPHRWPYIDWPGAERSKAWPSPKWP